MSKVLITFVSTFFCIQVIAANSFSIKPLNKNILKAGKIIFSFQLYNEQTKKNIAEKDLVKTHTKVLHFIAYDASRNEFNHVHPVYKDKNWIAELEFPTNGKYFFWAQGQLKNKIDISTFVNVQIAEGKPENPIIPLGDRRKATFQSTTLEFENTPLSTAGMVMLNYKISRSDGKPSHISPYLGALAHVIAVSPDGNELIHVHPMDGSAPNTGMLHATFPTAGDYRVWVQMNDYDELKTIPLSLTVVNRN